MEKPAQTDYPIHDLLRQRYSTIAFDGYRPVEADKVGSLLEAARWSASCFNEQPWRFIMATKQNPTAYQKLLGCIVEANQTWAKNADILMISVGKQRFTRNDNPNPYGMYDVGQALGTLTIQAEAIGLRVHQMGGFDKEKAREVYGIPIGFEPAAAVAIGYPADLTSLEDEGLKEREMSPRVRKPLSEIVFSETWEQSYF
ncbi:nitroreductase [[Leptolyngbya] sp. PCC 7376]|uniref:nitroreductase family protein n=1 Tax=[Leptolyngbya] sp. PCC 7376 TaxID=111781 RepID=UPI00029ECBBA|nr:nitroreductase family protein [[Leptolyngbya] sp. PCC 7376]AFY38223.1 nitroreductase [[Leptolyngbya] sp. PCC 7376]